MAGGHRGEEGRGVRMLSHMPSDGEGWGTGEGSELQGWSGVGSKGRAHTAEAAQERPGWAGSLTSLAAPPGPGGCHN